MVQQLLSNAARDGARAAMLEGATATAVETAVTDYLTQSDVTDVSVAVSPNPIALAQGGDPVQVTVQVPFNSVSWLSPVRFLNDITLSATVTMRREVFTSSTESSESGGEMPPPEPL